MMGRSSGLGSVSILLMASEYEEDSRADVDMNVIGTAKGDLVEVQGTAEGHVFSRAQLNELLDMAFKGIREIAAAQVKAIG